VAFDRRLTRLRVLVDRLERLPASARREWMLEEARARMADVETGDQPHALRTLEEPSPPPSSGSSQTRNGRAVKRPSSKPATAAARHAQAQPGPSTQEPPRSVPEPAPRRIAGTDSSAAMLSTDELLWLDDPSRGGFDGPGDGSAGITPWRRGLRG
jgi:hypothetical protein